MKQPGFLSVVIAAGVLALASSIGTASAPFRLVLPLCAISQDDLYEDEFILPDGSEDVDPAATDTKTGFDAWGDGSGTDQKAEIVLIKEFDQLPDELQAQVEKLPPGARAEFKKQLKAHGVPVPRATIEGEKAAPQTSEDQAAAELLKKYVAIKKVSRRPSHVLKELGRAMGSNQTDASLDPAAEPEAEQPAPKGVDADELQRGVIQGNWEAVGEHLASLPAEHAVRIYSHMLQLLANNGNYVRPGEILDVAAASPSELDRSQLELLGKMLLVSLQQVDEPRHLLKQIEQGSKNIGGSDPQKRLAAARLLIAAGMLREAAKYLPALDDALEEDDLDVLNLHIQKFRLGALSLTDPRKSQVAIVAAWWLCRAIVSSPKKTSAPRREAFGTMVGMLDEVPEQLSTEWLQHLFRTNPAEGLVLLAIVSDRVDSAYRQRDQERRLEQLAILKRVFDVLLPVAVEQPSQWTLAVRMVSLGWINEAQKCLGGTNRKLQYPDDHKIRPLSPEQLLPLALDDIVYEFLQPDTGRHLRRLTASVAARAGDKAETFRLVRQINRYDTSVARQVAEEFVASWTAELGNPGAWRPAVARRYLQRGYSMQQVRQMRMRAMHDDDDIPLTRAKQVRSLEKLAVLRRSVERLDLEPLTMNVWLDAFVQCHSPAEIFLDKDIETSFGSLDKMDAKLAAGLAMLMRERLAGPWRNPQLQQQMKTQRNDEELIAEVRRGYELAVSMMEFAIEEQGPVPGLKSTLATILFDQAEFEYGQLADLEKYIEMRDRAFAEYDNAARSYALSSKNTIPSEWQAAFYLQWFQAALGASDMAYLTRQDRPEKTQIEKIGKAIRRLGNPRADAHFQLFAESIDQTIGSIPPHLKAWCLRNALIVLGDHESGEPMRNLVSYYDELLDELELKVAVDGPAETGHSRPFGIQLTLRHTAAFGRESRGFNWLLQSSSSSRTGNQIDNKEAIEEELRTKLAEGFDIHEIKFHRPTVVPRGFGRSGWRETPLCYAVLSAKDAAVDRIPSIQLDLNFRDGTGTVLLPVTSAEELIDATSAEPLPRPLANLDIRQTLDERKLQDGILRLEVTATGEGLVGDLDEVLKLDKAPGAAAIAGFRVKTVEDNGLSVLELDTKGAEIKPRCERSWLVEFEQDSGQPTPDRFVFPAGHVADAAISYERYADADIESAAASLPLAIRSPVSRNATLWTATIAIAAVVLFGMGVFVVVALRRRQVQDLAISKYRRPKTLSAFTLVALLKRIQRDDHVVLSAAERDSLNATVSELEDRYFSRGVMPPDRPLDSDAVSSDLEALLDRWLPVATANGHSASNGSASQP